VIRERPWQAYGRDEENEVFRRTIIGGWKEVEAGAKTADLARRLDVSAALTGNRKSTYGGLEVFDAKRLTVQEDENAKLKRMLAHTIMDKAGL